jgi:hypothetical protein
MVKVIIVLPVFASILALVLTSPLSAYAKGSDSTIASNSSVPMSQGNKTNSTNAPNLQAGFQKGKAPTVSTSNNNITLGNPFYIESNKITSQVPVPLRSGGNATGIIFNGNGTVQGIGFNEIGRALIIPISSKIANIEGGLLLKSNDGGNKSNGNATLSFREIGHLTASGVQGSGAAIFNPNATGNLSFLSNKVAMFTHNGNRNGTNMVKAWEWK